MPRTPTAHPLSRNKLALGHLEGRTRSSPPGPGSVIPITCRTAHCRPPPHPQTTRPASQGHTTGFGVAHSSPLPIRSSGRPTCRSTPGWRRTSSPARLAGAFWGPDLHRPQREGSIRRPRVRQGGRPEVPCGAETLRPAATQRRRREGGAGRAGGRGRQEGAGAAAVIKPPRRLAG